MADTVPAPLKGKTAIVTGASRGIGAGIALVLARGGCTHISITYAANKTAAEKTVRAIHDINNTIKTCIIQGDVRDLNFGKMVVDESLKGLGVDHIDIMVSNAALLDIENYPPISELPFEQWSGMITSEAWAPLELARNAFKVMPNGGRIVMISSGASKLPQGDPIIPYAAAKAALDAVARNLAVMYAPKNITVNSISVGATRTDTLENAFKAMPGFEQKIEALSPLNRIGTVDDVAEIVGFVATPQAGYLALNPPESYLFIQDGLIIACGAVYSLCYVFYIAKTYRDKVFCGPLEYMIAPMAYEFYYAFATTSTNFERGCFLMWYMLDIVFVWVASHCAYPPSQSKSVMLRTYIGAALGVGFFHLLCQIFPDERQQVTAYWTGLLIQFPCGLTRYFGCVTAYLVFIWRYLNVPENWGYVNTWPSWLIIFFTMLPETIWPFVYIRTYTLGHHKAGGEGSAADMVPRGKKAGGAGKKKA
ncbi:hypothetical protein KC351_g10111 [Hortaea werneckii]|nr:hypothetical protein KC351_g10111 [Hortaea werneckii]